jgi:pimeloyl-ACP methyl ester carboxylesterase
VRLHTATVGNGPRRAALVHGLADDGTTWHDLAGLLAATGDYTVTMLDLRGHGESPRSDSYEVRDFAGDLIDTLPCGLDLIVSHSLGGPVVAQVVAELASKRAVYLDPGFRLALPTGVGGWLVLHVPLLLPLVIAFTRRGVRPSALTAENQSRVDAAHARWDRPMALRVFAAVATWSRPASSSAIPSTVVLSEDARFVVPDPLPEQLAAEGWDVRRLPGLGHSLHHEDPRAVFDAIADLL